MEHGEQVSEAVVSLIMLHFGYLARFRLLFVVPVSSVFHCDNESASVTRKMDRGQK